MTAQAKELVDHVAKSDAIVKSQQIGEPDLSYDEKCHILHQLLKEKPATFLSRFAKYLEFDDLNYFEPFRHDFEVDFYVKEAKSQLDSHKTKRTVSNRRYEYLKQMKQTSSDYFSDTEMRRRCPHLFEEFIGQHMTHAEREKMLCASSGDPNEACSLSGFLFSRIDEKEIQLKQAYEMYLEDNALEEEDDSESEIEDNDDGINLSSKISRVEKERLRAEFISMMEDRFMEGKDEEFDYNSVDSNKEYDPVNDFDVDAQEAYFDSEEPYVHNTISVTTTITMDED